MITKTKIERKIDELKMRIPPTDYENFLEEYAGYIKFAESRATLTQTNEIIELIEKERESEKKLSKLAEYSEQGLECFNQIEMCNKILKKIKGGNSK